VALVTAVVAELGVVLQQLKPDRLTLQPTQGQALELPECQGQAGTVVRVWCLSGSLAQGGRLNGSFRFS